MERSCQRCGERFEAKRADKMYCSGACKQAAVRARRGVRVARRPPALHDDLLSQRLADLEDRQRTILTDLDHLESHLPESNAMAALEALVRRVESLEASAKTMAKALETLKRHQREHETALTAMAELLASEPWRR